MEINRSSLSLETHLISNAHKLGNTITSDLVMKGKTTMKATKERNTPNNADEKVAAFEQKRRNNLFLWALVVVAVNAAWLLTKNNMVQAISTVITVYAFYRVVVYDNHKNRYSRRLYDRTGRRLTDPKIK